MTDHFSACDPPLKREAKSAGERNRAEEEEEEKEEEGRERGDGGAGTHKSPNGQSDTARRLSG